MLNVVKILNREEYKEEKLKTLQVIKNLLFKNYPIDEIQEITGSDIEKSIKLKHLFKKYLLIFLYYQVFLFLF